MCNYDADLVKELRAARRAIRQMKSHFNRFDEGYAVGKIALRRLNKVLKPTTVSTAVSTESAGEDARQLALAID